MVDLLRSICRANHGNSSLGSLSDRGYQLFEEIRDSDEWLKFSKAIAEADSDKTVPSTETKAANKSQPLTEREGKIWAVIQQGNKGRAYSRELDNANIAPRRDGVWKDAPRKYAAAYDLGGPWPHRIEDEKAKIRRKAEKLAGALASE